jgi:hypothetical protein
MTGRKTTESRIRGIPDRIVTGGGIDKTVYIATGLVCGECQDCNKRIFVETHLGIMCCSHCGAPANRIKWIWGKIRTVFVPEGELDTKYRR